MNCLLNHFPFSGEPPETHSNSGNRSQKRGPLRLAKYYSDGTVFQRGPDQGHNVWGFTENSKDGLWVTEICDGQEVASEKVQKFEFSSQVRKLYCLSFMVPSRNN